MIIVEGPDGSGKTTLIERLGFERKHLKALRSGVGSEGTGNWGAGLPAIEAYANQLLTAPLNQAFDRFYLSETIYGPLLRGASAIRSPEVTVLQRLITGMNIPEIICLPGFDTTFGNVTREGRERPAYQTDAFLRESYDDFSHASGRGNRYITWNYETQPLPEMQPSLAQTPWFVGQVTGRVLIVGRGHSRQFPWPLFTMDGEAGLINATLWYSRISEWDLMFIDPAKLPWGIGQCQVILALDDESHDACCRLSARIVNGRLYANLAGATPERLREVLRSVRGLLKLTPGPTR